MLYECTLDWSCWFINTRIPGVQIRPVDIEGTATTELSIQKTRTMCRTAYLSPVFGRLKVLVSMISVEADRRNMIDGQSLVKTRSLSGPDLNLRQSIVMAWESNKSSFALLNIILRLADKKYQEAQPISLTCNVWRASWSFGECHVERLVDDSPAENSLVFEIWNTDLVLRHIMPYIMMSTLIFLSRIQRSLSSFRRALEDISDICQCQPNLWNPSQMTIFQKLASMTSREIPCYRS